MEHYTVASMNVNVAVLDDFEQRDETPLGRAWGEVRVTARPTIFKKLRISDDDNVGWGTIDLPEQEMHTQACWAWMRPELTETLSRAEIESGLWGARHLLPNVAAVYLMCDPHDLGVVSEIKSPFTQAPTLYLYDRYPGGVGLSERLFASFDQVMQAAADLAADCDCHEGCPACVGPPVADGISAKAATLRVLQARAAVREPPLRSKPPRAMPQHPSGRWRGSGRGSRSKGLRRSRPDPPRPAFRSRTSSAARSSPTTPGRSSSSVRVTLCRAGCRRRGPTTPLAAR